MSQFSKHKQNMLNTVLNEYKNRYISKVQMKNMKKDIFNATSDEELDKVQRKYYLQYINNFDGNPKRCI